MNLLDRLPPDQVRYFTALRYRITQVGQAPLPDGVPEERQFAHGVLFARFGRLAGVGDNTIIERADLLDALIDNPLCVCGLSSEQHHNRAQLGVTCVREGGEDQGFRLDEAANQWEIERGLRWLFAHKSLAVEAETTEGWQAVKLVETAEEARQAAAPKKRGPGRPSLKDDPVARDLYEQSENIRRAEPGITINDLAARMKVSGDSITAWRKAFR